MECYYYLSAKKLLIYKQKRSIFSSRLLLRRMGEERQRVYRSGQFFRQDPVNHALPVDPGVVIESRRYDRHPEMALATRAGAGMAGMLRRFILDLQAVRRQPIVQLAPYRVRDSHARQLSSNRTDRD